MWYDGHMIFLKEDGRDKWEDFMVKDRNMYEAEPKSNNSSLKILHQIEESCSRDTLRPPSLNTCARR